MTIDLGGLLVLIWPEYLKADTGELFRLALLVRRV